MNVRLLAIILISVCVLFLAVGVDIVLSQQKAAASRMKVMEPPEEMRSRIAGKMKDRLSPGRPFRAGSSLIEQRHASAVKELHEDRLESVRRRQSKERIRSFLETQSGQYLDQGIKLLARGQKTEARLYIERALSQHQAFDFEIYAVMLKALVHSYVKPEDLENLDQAILGYLKLIQAQYSEQGFQKVVSLLMEAVEEKLANED